MDDLTFRDAAAVFFDEFVEAFRSFDGSEIARRYHTPYLALHGDGAAQCFTSPSDIASYFQDVVDSYHGKGCRSCRYKDLDVASMGLRSALGTVTWELLRQDGSVLVAWRESYILTQVSNGLRVVASVDHAK